MSKTRSERAQDFLNALHLYNPELKHENDEINKEAIIRMLSGEARITKQTCSKNLTEMGHHFPHKYALGEYEAIAVDEAKSVIHNTFCE